MRGSKRPRPDRARGGQTPWQLRVDAGRDPLTNKRRQISKLFYGTSREADRELARMVAAVSDEQTPAAATLHQLVARWYDHTKDQLSPSTRHGYEWRIALIGRSQVGQIRLAKLTAQHLDEFYLHLSREGGRKGTGQSPATIQQTHSLIRKALGMGVAWGWVDRNVALLADRPRVERREVEVPSRDRLSRILEVVRAHPEPRLWPLVRLGLATGARRGELCALRWHRVAGGRVVFASSLVHLRGEVPAWVEKPPKTGRVRAVELDPSTVEVLSEHREAQERLWGDLGCGWDPEGFVFATEPGVPWLPDRVTQLWRRIPECDGVKFHALRHASVSLLLDAGLPVGDVSRRVGHSITSTTSDIYGHRLEGADARAALTIGRLLDDLGGT